MKKNSRTFAINMVHALLSLTKDSKVHTQTLCDLEAVQNALQGSTDVRLFLLSPDVSLSQKVDFFRGVKVSPHALAVLESLLEYGYIDNLSLVVQNYKEFLNRQKTTVNGTVYIAEGTSLSNASLKALEKKVSKQIKGTVHLKTAISKEIDGGFILEAGDLYLDGSLRKTLSDIKRLAAS